MKKYLIKANTLIADRRYERGLFVLSGMIGILGYFILVSKEIDSSKASPAYLNQTEIISCAPNSFYNEPFDPSLEQVQINDNRKAAGELRNGIYYINLEVREGYWYPASKEGNPIKIKAFAETGKPLQVPGPLIRVPEGTEIRVSVRNSIKNALALYGFTRRLYEPKVPKDSIIINEGETKELSFNGGKAGTLLYTAKDRADTLTPDATATPFLNSQLYGAFIIDAANEKINPRERIFMIGMCGVRRTNNDILAKYVINGLTWPYTERVSYRQGEKVDWRIINASVLGHPMHLHGFPFVVNSLADIIIPVEKRREVVTQHLGPLGQMRMTWVPAKEGNWLFHCHLLDHVLPASAYNEKENADHDMNAEAHARNGMGGLVMGILVQPDKRYAKKNPVKTLPERKMTLLVGEQSNNYFHNSSGKGFQLLDGQGIAISKQYSIPGPPLILTKNQPVAITIVNNLKEPTTIHWHGLEIDSYYDGVAGWGNNGKNLAPLIQPGDSFTVRITPPRAGSFMYHTHMHDRQMLDGLYGPLVVLEPGETYHPETDKIIMISQGASNTLFTKNWIKGFTNLQFLINGNNRPVAIELKKGTKYRLRLMNITAQANSYYDLPLSGFFVSLKKNGQPVTWKETDQDGMNLPARLQEIRPALNQRLGQGTTKDFEFTPDQVGDYELEMKYERQVLVTQIIKVEE